MVSFALPVAVAAALALPAAPAETAAGAEISAVRAKETVARIARLGPRPAGSPNERRAARIVTNRFEALGYPVTIQRFRLPNGWYSQNVVARSPGRLRVVVVAHLDGVREGPAANDNASGVAAMLEVAAALRGRRGVLLAALGAEERVETGSRLHLGSARLVGSFRRTTREGIRFAVSLDMVGVGPTFYVRGLEASPNRSARRALAHARRLGLRATYRRDPGYSDHAELTRGGIPAAWLEWAWDPCWHSPCDRAHRVRAWKLAAAARVTAASARAALNVP